MFLKLTLIVTAGRGIQAESLGTGRSVATDCAMGPGRTTVDEMRHEAGAGSPRTNGFT